MKKVILTILLSFILLSTNSPVQAVILRPIRPVKPIILPTSTPTIIELIQESIKILTGKLESLEKKINELEQKIANLSGNQNGEDFNLPQQWNIGFFQSMDGEIPVDNPKDEELCNETSCRLISTAIIKISTPDQSNNSNDHCNWKGATIDSAVTTTMIGHLPNGDIYGTGTCKEMVFENIKSLPESGKSFEADIHLYWYGTGKDKKISITVPSRPFPIKGTGLLDNSTLKIAH